MYGIEAMLRYVKKKDFFALFIKVNQSFLVRGLTPRKRKSLLKTCRPRWFEAFSTFGAKLLQSEDTTRGNIIVPF